MLSEVLDGVDTVSTEVRQEECYLTQEPHILFSVYTFALWSRALRSSALHAIRNIDVEQSNQDIGGDCENNVQCCQSLEVIVGVALQPVDRYRDDAVNDEQRSD